MLHLDLWGWLSIFRFLNIFCVKGLHTLKPRTLQTNEAGEILVAIDGDHFYQENHGVYT